MIKLVPLICENDKLRQQKDSIKSSLRLLYALKQTSERDGDQKEADFWEKAIQKFVKKHKKHNLQGFVKKHSGWFKSYKQANRI